MTGVANSDQRDYWNGDASREWAEKPTRFDEMLAPFVAVVLDAAQLDAGERVLDLGCGNGATTIAAAERVRPGGASAGVDLSAPMIANARERSAAVDDVTFEVADAQVDDLGGPYDAAISRFGIMFFDDPAAAFTNVARSLAADGRIAFVCWAPPPENPWMSVPMGAMFDAIGPPPGGLPGPDQPGPFRYGDPRPLLDALESAGFVDTAAERLQTTILLGGRGGLDDARAFIAQSGMTRAILGDASDDDRERALSAVGAALEPHVTDEGVRMGAAVWIVTGHR